MKEVKERDIHRYDILYVDSKIWQIGKKYDKLNPSMKQNHRHR